MYSVCLMLLGGESESRFSTGGSSLGGLAGTSVADLEKKGNSWTWPRTLSLRNGPERVENLILNPFPRI